MLRDPQGQLLGIGKLLLVLVAGVLVAVGFVPGLAKRIEGADTRVSATSSTPAERTTPEVASTLAPQTTTADRVRTATTGAQTTPAGPRVEVLDTRLGSPSATAGQVRVVIRLRIINRTTSPLMLDAPTLRAGDDVVRLDPAAKDAAEALLTTLAPGARATGALRFIASAAIGRRLRANAALRIAGRTIALRLRVAQ